MRIAILTFAVPWSDRPTNGLYNVDQARALNEAGHQTEIFSIAPALPRALRVLGGAIERQLNRPTRYDWNGVPISTVRAPAAYPDVVRAKLCRTRPGAVASCFAKLAGPSMNKALDDFGPDAVLIHGMLPWADLAIAYAEARGIPVVCIEHSQGDVLRVTPGSPLETYYLTMGRKCRSILAVGAAMVDHLQALGLENTTLIRNGVNTLDNPRPLRNTRRDSDRLVVLAAGQYIPRKGHRILIDAFANASLGDAVLRFVGEPPSELRMYAESRGLGHRFEWVPTMSNERLLSEMGAADVFALPSWSEAFGLVFMEALGVGTPVIMTSDAGAAAYIQQTVQGWVVPPRDPTAVTLALEAARRVGRDGRRRMGREGRRLVLREFGWDRNAQAVVSALSHDTPGTQPRVWRERKGVA